MTKYFLEISNRLVLILFSWASTLWVSYFYKEVILFLISQPNDSTSLHNFDFIFTSVTEVFDVYTQLSYFISLQSSTFCFIYNASAFLCSAFSKREYLFFIFFFKLFVILWLGSFVFFNFIITLLVFDFFLSFHQSVLFNVYFEAKLNEYLSFYTAFYYFNTFYFQLFTFLLILFHCFEVNLDTIKRFRKVYYYFILVLVNLVVSLDFITQLLLILSTVVFFELFCFCFCFKFSLKTL